MHINHSLYYIQVYLFFNNSFLKEFWMCMDLHQIKQNWQDFLKLGGLRGITATKQFWNYTHTYTYDKQECDHIRVIKNAARGTNKKQHKLLRKHFGKKPIAKAKF